MTTAAYNGNTAVVHALAAGGAVPCGGVEAASDHASHRPAALPAAQDVPLPAFGRITAAAEGAFTVRLEDPPLELAEVREVDLELAVLPLFGAATWLEHALAGRTRSSGIRGLEKEVGAKHGLVLRLGRLSKGSLELSKLFEIPS